MVQRYSGLFPIRFDGSDLVFRHEGQDEAFQVGIGRRERRGMAAGRG
jgi:hypothetical protein